MDHHRSRSPNSNVSQALSSRRPHRRDDNGGNHSGNRHLRQNHHHNHQSGPTPPQSLLSSRALSTRRELYERDFPVYKQPVEVGSFSLDSKRRFFNDSRQLRYFVEPGRNPNFNLRDGYKDRFIKRDDSVKEKLDHILRWILANKSKLKSSATTSTSGYLSLLVYWFYLVSYALLKFGTYTHRLTLTCDLLSLTTNVFPAGHVFFPPLPSALDLDFVTWRGHLTKLLTTPYETREGWLLAVTRFRGTLYISEVETEAARRDRENRTERHEEMMYWGYKFEQYTCTGSYMYVIVLYR